MKQITQQRGERGSKVIAKKGSRDVYTAIPQNKEWVTAKVCVNATSEKIPLSHYFKG